MANVALTANVSSNIMTAGGIAASAPFTVQNLSHREVKLYFSAPSSFADPADWELRPKGTTNEAVRITNQATVFAICQADIRLSIVAG